MNKILLQTLICLPAFGWTSAFQHFQQSAISIGYANADMAALADDPSTAYYNPAGMTRLDKDGFVLGMASTNIWTDFKGKANIINSPDVNSLNGVEAFLGFPELATHTGHHTIKNANGNDVPILGYFHSVVRIPNSFTCQNMVDISFGLSLTSPWDFETDYKVSKIGTYTSKTMFQSFAVTPSVALRFLDMISVGVGASYQQLKFDTDNIIMGSSADVKLKDWKWTWNVGVLFEWSDCTRIGVTYRPQVNYNMRGNLRSIDTNVSSRSRFTLPQTASIGFYQQVTPCFDLMATIVYTNWNQFKPIKIFSDTGSETFSGFSFSSPVAIDFVFDPSIISIPILLQDTFFVGLGGRYWVNNWQVRGGIGYDSKPIKRGQRELRLPDNNHYIAAFGLGYNFNQCLSFDFGYQFIFVPKSSIEHNEFFPFAVSIPQGSPSDLNDVAFYSGTTESMAQVISFQMKWEF